MISKDNFKTLLLSLEFQQQNNQFHKIINNTRLAVDFDKHELQYPDGLIIHERQTCNFSANENFVVFECVHRLLEKGYAPDSIELEPKWKLGHGASGGRADILVKDRENKPLLIIECKTAGTEYKKALKYTLFDGGQLFSYAQQIPATQFLCLYASDFSDKKFTRDYIVISHIDNDKIAPKDGELKRFDNAQSVIERFEVWKNTYQLELLPSVIFEEKSQAYIIGKDKYTLADLKIVDARDKEGKYHQFRTILRKYNVARRENAFEVLVNLFLCKIVDETQNNKLDIEHQELKFYWKGIAYDSYFELVDRLQSLYQTGMDKFLNQDVIYISNEEIDNAFWAVKNDKNATKKRIKELFTQLKFYKGLDFDFIKVHNKTLFEKNAKVLIEIVQMWQDSRLTTHEQNQFLGDMFEYFLDNGIKQSEGQFFTPMPICRFILMSLPLDDLIQCSEYAPKVIDYACGAGHFLNEYAAQIKPLLTDDKHFALNDCYAEIVGIEKEDRLAKVAKVSAFMYGQDAIKIIDADALATHEKLKSDSFNVLVANPPFAVEGFLETLEEDRENYTLLNTISDVVNNRNIQCFFIERAKQLLAPKGIAAIIVPSSVLSNSDATHIGSREILLQYFDIVAIVELGSGTFGKTGTNTVVLFLRRKHKQPTEAEHYKNRVDDWFNGLTADAEQAIYQDENIIKKYCEQIAIDFASYQSLLAGEPNSELLATELFVDYHHDFYKSVEVKNLITRHEKQLSLLAKKLAADIEKQQKDNALKLTIKEIQEQVKTLLPEERIKLIATQTAELNAKFLAYLQTIEKDKLFYFALAYHNPQKVLIVKSPSDGKEQKAFLGYEWSAAKGNEGIKLTTDNENNHLTPLYDVTNRDNPEKINFLITQNFLGNTLDLNLRGLEDLAGLVTQTRLADMLDFSRKDFDKTISLNFKKSVEIKTRWQIKKLSDLIEIIGGGTPDTNNSEYWNGDIPWLSVVDFNKNERFVSKSEKKITELGLKNSSTKYLQKGDLIISARGTVGALAQLAIPMTFNQSCYGLRAKSEIDVGYLFYVLKQEIQQFKDNAYGSKFDSITIKTFDAIKIPLPPTNIQQQIVADCEAIDSEAQTAEQFINNSRLEIENIIINLSNQDYTENKLSEITHINPSKTELKGIDENITVSFVEMASVSNNGFIQYKEDRLLKDLKKGSYTYFKENDIIIAKITPCMENGKCALAIGLTNHLAMGSSEFHVIRCDEKTISAKYVFSVLNRVKIRQEAERNMTGSSGHRRVPASFYEDYKIPVPDIETQQTLVIQIEQLENKIAIAQKTINEAANKKQAVLKQYL